MEKSSPITTQFPQLTVPCPETPWRMHSQTFAKLSQSTNSSYKTYTLTTADPEYAFVYRYFHAQQPTNRALKRIVCIHQSRQNNVFENTIPSMETEANNETFKPKWHKEDNASHRQQTMTRFGNMVSQFSPFSIPWTNSRKESFKNVRVLPLWHGSDAQKCDSICRSGFTFFGKHSYFGAQSGNQSTDVGYFGSGIYFTTSARYAADLYSDGEHLLLAWVSMRDPYPVINDLPVTQKGSDMKKLEGRGAFENYNAHYIPVVAIDPKDKTCAIYYPCYQSQEPACDEIVVFQPSQTLVRFWVEMAVDLPSNVKEASLNVGGLIDFVLNLLEQEAIKSNQELSTFLGGKAEVLIALDTSAELSVEDRNFYTWAKKLLDEQKKVRSFVVGKLMGSSTRTPQPSAHNISVLPSLPSNEVKSEVKDEVKSEVKSPADIKPEISLSQPSLPKNVGIVSTFP